MNAQSTRQDLAFLSGADPQRQRGLSWLNWSAVAALSDDGKYVLFNSGWENVAFLRPTDGSPAVKLGAGEAQGFSPDEKSVLVIPEGRMNALSVIPIGVGEASSVPLADTQVLTAQRLRDGKRVVFFGKHPSSDKQYHLYVVPLEGGVPARLSDAPLIPKPNRGFPR